MRAQCRSAAATVALAVLAHHIRAEGRLTRFDRCLTDAIATHDRRHSAGVARIVTSLGSTPLGYLLLVAAVAAGRRRGDRTGWSPLLTAAAAHGARWAIARMVDRPRPPRSGRLVRANGPSFPSRHTSTAAVVAGLAIQGPQGRATGRWLAHCAVAAVAFSRVWLGVHWPTDVAAGWLHAQAWLGAADALDGRRRHRAQQSLRRQSAEQ